MNDNTSTSTTQVDEMDEPKRTPAESLTKGWTWVDFADGSGCLEAPDGECYYSYDLAPYFLLNGIEYKETRAAHWNIFWKASTDTKGGILTEFKEWAELRMLNKGN